MAEQLKFLEEIQDLLRRDPFVPFTITLTNGDRYEVTGPFQVAIGENVTVVVPPRRTLSFFRTNQIVGVDVKEPAT